MESLNNAQFADPKDVEVGELYLDSEEIISLVKKNAIFQEEDFSRFLTRFRKVYERLEHEKERPNISYKAEKFRPDNNPFQVLKGLFDK